MKVGGALNMLQKEGRSDADVFAGLHRLTGLDVGGPGVPGASGIFAPA